MAEETAVERRVPRHVPAVEVDAPAPAVHRREQFDAIKIGEQAAMAVSSCAESIQHIRAMLSAVDIASKEIKDTGNGLIADLESRMLTIQKVVNGYAEVAASSAKRMSEERDLLKAVAGRETQ